MKTINRTQHPVFCLLTLLMSLTSASAAEIRKANNGDPLNHDSSWFGGIAPTSTDIALWDGDSSGSPAPPLADLNWGGIRILDMQPFYGGTMIIPSGPYTLALSNAGIDLSASQHDLEFNSGYVSLETNQVWHVGPGRVLTLDAENGAGTGGLWKVGPGVLRLAYDYAAASHLNNTAPLGLAGGTVRLEGSNPHAEVVGSTLVFGDATRVERWNGGSTLVLNNITRSVGGTVDFAQAGIASTTTTNDASENGGIIGGWATVNGQYWAQVGGGNQIDAYPTFGSTDFYETNNINLLGPGLVTAGTAINSLRFDFDCTLVVGTNGAFSLTNLTGGILMGGGAIQATIVSASPGRTLRGPPGGDLIYHVPYLGQWLTNQIVILDNATCGLTKCGEGTLLLNQGANNTYAGVTTINGGTVQMGNVNSRRYVSTNVWINPKGTLLHGTGENNLTTSAITVNGGTLNLGARNDSCVTLLLANNGSVTGFGLGKTFTVGNAVTPLDARWGTIDVALVAPGGIVKTTDRKLTIARDSTVTRDTRVENGALQVTGDATVTAGSLILGTATNNARLILGGTNASGVFTGGLLSVTNLVNQGTNAGPGPLFMNSIVGGSMTGDSRLILNYAHDTDFDLNLLGGPGPDENNVGLTKTGAGVLTLTNVGSFTGSIRNEIGTLKLSAAANIQNHVVDVASGLLDVNGFSATINYLSGAGNVSSSVGGAVTLKIGGSFDGVISDGSGTVSVVVTNGLQLNGLNTYSGDTTISNTSLALDADATIGSGTLNLGGGSVVFTASRATPIANPIHLTANTLIGIGVGVVTDATVEFTSSSISASTGTTLTFANDTCCLITNLFEPRFSGSFSFSRPIIITNATFQLGTRTGWTRLGSFNTNDTTQTYNGVLSGNGSFRRSANSGLGGVTVLGANNIYTGTTLVDNGTLLVNGGLGTNTVTVTNLGVLGGNGTIRGPVLVQNGGVLSPGTSIGRLTISNALTLAGGSTTFLELNQSTNDFVTGLTSISYGGTLSLSNLVGTLTNGSSFKLFSATNYSGAFTNIVPATPGAGLVWNTSSLVTNGTLRVVAAPSPQFDSVTLTGSNLILTGTGGTTNGSYYVLTATNITLPVSSWDSLITNTFDGSGNFTFTNAISPTTPQRFYRLQLP